MLASHSLDKTGLWLIRSWVRLQRMDCEEKMHDFSVVPPIHSSPLVNKEVTVWKDSSTACPDLSSHLCRVKVLSPFWPPLGLSPRGDASGFAARRGGLSLCWPHASHAAGHCYQQLPRNNPLRRSCLITSLSSMIPIPCKFACNTFSSSSYYSATYVPLNRCNLYESWEVSVILTPFSQIYVYLGRPDIPKKSVMWLLNSSSKHMGKNTVLSWSGTDNFPLFPPKLKWTCMTYTY